MSVIFYSRNCINCRDFLKKLKEEHMLEYFDEFFCTDGRKTLPEFLHSVPTIIVADADKPLVGDEAFSWLTYKLDQKYKKHELGTLDEGFGTDFVSLTEDPMDISLDSKDYISIQNIGKSLKPEMTDKFAESGSTKTMDQIVQERNQLLNEQKGPTPQTPNFHQ